ncbi:MAG TPA: nucleoside-diphosphate kinase [Thermomicrobiales bacterium]|nr:nucleoside-diphosphate kinase [Thermomicrobiales bacterium]
MADYERTLVIVKPDGMQRGLVGEIVGRLERRGLKLEGLKLIQIDRALAERHYAEHQGKGFYEGLVAYITACPVVVAVFAGAGAIAAVRATVGKTNPAEAAPGTIRGDLALEVGRNLIHASDGPESARREVGLFFSPNELLTYARATDPWITERAGS